RMWDTWMFRDGDVYHLFTLTQPYGKPAWDRVCHAVTTDWRRWEERSEILLQDTQNTRAWDANVILTGSVFRTPDGYGMTYGSCHEDREKIGLLLSRDLDSWRKHPANPVLCARGPYYEAAPEDTAQRTVPWRDAYVIPAADGGYEAFVCAGDMRVPKTVNGCIARVSSRDLVNWEYHSPIASPARHLDMEVPQYFALNGFHYLLYSTSGIYRRIHLPSRQCATGTFYLVSDAKYGPYRVPDDHLLIGSGEGRVDCYVGKIIETDDGPLLYHHICGYRTAFAAPKVVGQNPDGTLFLERWPGLDGLLGTQQLGPGSPGQVVKALKKWPIGEWQSGGSALTGNAGVAMSAWLFDQPLGDFAVRCTVNLSGAARAGVIFRIHEGDTRSEKGWAVSLDRERSRIELCRPILQCRTSLRVDPLDVVYGALPDRCAIEVWVRDSYVEVYVNNRPRFVLNTSPVTATDHVTSGRFGLFVENGSARFSDLRVADIPVTFG
ncbi:MAG: hypothetical protein KKD76_02625, partial [Verrucomicrobia bacterium]|nr:hypothetical protein [Verrucomicrobiota bacterium]